MSYDYDSYEDDEENWDSYHLYGDEPEIKPLSFSLSKYGLCLYEIKKNARMRYFKSRHILIGDVDCGSQGVDLALTKIGNYAQQKKASFRIYQTKNGLRFFQTDIFYQGVNRRAISLMQSLDCDPKYIYFSHKLGYFAARVTPKLDNYDEYFSLVLDDRPTTVRVSHLLSHALFADVNPAIEEAIETHDLLTRIRHTSLPLA